MSDEQIREIVHEETSGYRVEYDIRRKHWPADELVMVWFHLGSSNEWVLVGPGSSAASVRKSVRAAVGRLEEAAYGV